MSLTCLAGEQGCVHPGPEWAGKGSTLGCGEPWGAQQSSPCSPWEWPMLSGELTSTEDPPLHAADLRSPTEFCAKISKSLEKAATESQKDKENADHICV